jgi:serine/threonine protein kinase/predicted TPR repeat methyltransferase
MTETAPYEVGERIGGRYDIHRILGGEGRSGMGIVYVVYEHELGNVFALKTFQDKFLASPEARTAFQQEALSWTYLDRHPWIVRAHWVEEFSTRHYIVLEYIAPDEQGRNCLTHYLTGEPLPPDQALRWAIQFCHAMEHANAKGIACHRDIKPDNVMITSTGTVKITDFGLARAAEHGLATGQVKWTSDAGGPSLSLTMAGGKAVCGTPGYMAPEVVRGEGADVRSDIYSFGLLLWQMSTGNGQPPFAPPLRGDVDTYLRETYQRQMHQPPPRVDSPLWPVIERSLAPDPGQRYQDFASMRADLEELLQRETGEAVEPPDTHLFEAWEWNDKGYALFSLGRCDEAITCYDSALNIWPRFAACLTNKGMALGALGYLDEAILLFDQAIDIDPNLPQPFHNKGYALYLLGRYEKAIGCFDRALHLRPRSAFTWNDKGLALMAMGRTGEAIVHYDRAIAIDAHDAKVWFNKGLALQAVGRQQEAAYCYQRVVDLDPLHVEAWYNWGVILHSVGRLREAITCYDNALRINPQHINAWNNMGVVFDALGQFEDAAHAYRQFLAVATEEDAAYIQQVQRRLWELGRW